MIIRKIESQRLDIDIFVEDDGIRQLKDLQNLLERNEYEDSFQAYLIEQKDILQMFRRTMQNAPDKTAAAEEISEVILTKGRERKSQEKTGKCQFPLTLKLLLNLLIAFRIF